MTKIKVRFNLGRGQNYMKWKVQFNKHVTYYDPELVCLEMHRCKLKNNKKTAELIFRGKHKTVCAWIECDSINVFSPVALPVHVKGFLSKRNKKRIKYNPRENPFWTYNGKNIDNKEYDFIRSKGNKLFIN